MRKIILLSTLFAITTGVFAQSGGIEKLRQEIKTHTREDTFRVNRLNELANSGALTLDENSKLANEALAISQKTGYAIGEGYAKLNLALTEISNGNKTEANALISQADSIAEKTGDRELLINVLMKKASNAQFSNNNEAIAFGLKAEKLSQETGNKNLISRCQFLIASIYQNSLSDYSKAMEYAMKSMSSAEEAECMPCLASSWNTIGALYNIIGDQEKSLLYYQKAFDANKELGNTRLKVNLLMNIGERYRLMGKYPEAIHAYKESMKEQKTSYSMELVKSDLADVYVRIDSLPLAFEYAFSALAIAKKINDIEGVAWIDGILSRAYLKKKMPDSALYYAMQGLDAAKQTGTIEFMRDNAEALANAYAFKNDFKNAYIYHDLYTTYHDSILNVEVGNKSRVLEYNYDLEKKQAQIAALNQQKKLQQNFLISISVVLGLLVITALLLLRNNRQKQKAKRKIEKAYAELKSTQAQLIQSEKMASLGELTAGIAHEIQNPLNFVNNFSEVNGELIEELRGEKLKEKSERDEALEDELLNDIAENEKKINLHGKRADAIVKSMLQHSRSSTGQKEPTNINALTDEYLRLAYHGMRAKDKSFNATMNTDYDKTLEKVNVIPQDIGRVVLNLINNAFYAVSTEALAKVDREYNPTVSVSTRKSGDKILITVKDNGNGIPESIKDKIFQPFFTTKPTGQGTGLGLSLSYDIVKAHGGELKVKTKEGEGSEFVIELPIV
ncbi:MAG TPA: ATP-binding protein [Agriterribacter sp.]|nr:ATP-binding protein [Agriterribacter sp.]